jgi:hypothetical protein
VVGDRKDAARRAPTRTVYPAFDSVPLPVVRSSGILGSELAQKTSISAVCSAHGEILWWPERQTRKPSAPARDFPWGTRCAFCEADGPCGVRSTDLGRSVGPPKRSKRFFMLPRRPGGLRRSKSAGFPAACPHRSTLEPGQVVKRHKPVICAVRSLQVVGNAAERELSAYSTTSSSSFSVNLLSRQF